MFRRKQKRLKSLMLSFGDSDIADRLPEHLDMFANGEWGLALEMLSSDIYELDVPVSPEQERLFREVSPQFNVPVESHAFIGRSPPYPDLRTTEQMSDDERAEQARAHPSFESVGQRANLGSGVEAIRMYRAMTGADLRSAKEAVDRLAEDATETPSYK